MILKILGGPPKRAQARAGASLRMTLIKVQKVVVIKPAHIEQTVLIHFLPVYSTCHALNRGIRLESDCSVQGQAEWTLVEEEENIYVSQRDFSSFTGCSALNCKLRPEIGTEMRSS